MPKGLNGKMNTELYSKQIWCVFLEHSALEVKQTSYLSRVKGSVLPLVLNCWHLFLMFLKCILCFLNVTVHFAIVIML